MSIKDPEVYRGPQTIGSAYASALGGRITGVRETPESDYTDVDLPIEGVSSVLPGVGSASNRRTEVITFFKERPLIRLAHAYTSASATAIGEVGLFETEATVEGWELGLRKRLTFGSAHAQMSSRIRLEADAHTLSSYRPAREPDHRFAVSASVAGISHEGRPGFVRFRQLGTALSYDSLFREVVAGKLDDILLPRSACRKDSEFGAAIAIHLVEALEIPLATRISKDERGKPIGASNAVYFPDVGQVYFGELVVTPASSQFTLMRFQFGCTPKGGGTGPIIQNQGASHASSLPFSP